MLNIAVLSSGIRGVIILKYGSMELNQSPHGQLSQLVNPDPQRTSPTATPPWSRGEGL